MSDAAATAARLRGALRPIPDWPRPGITFQDITPVLRDGPLFHAAVRALAAPYLTAHVSHVVGIEARGFILGAPVAAALGAGFLPFRKPGKLPWDVTRERYALEYGEDALEAHRDACRPGDRVLIVDDVLATGGTAGAAAALVRQLGAGVVGVGVLLELTALGGRRRLEGVGVTSVVEV